MAHSYSSSKVVEVKDDYRTMMNLDFVIFYSWCHDTQESQTSLQRAARFRTTEEHFQAKILPSTL